MNPFQPNMTKGTSIITLLGLQSQHNHTAFSYQVYSLWLGCPTCILTYTEL